MAEIGTPTEKTAAAQSGYPADFKMHNTKRIDFVSKVNQRRYSILVSLPDAPPPPAGYPVMYVLDGEFQFASWTEAARFGTAPQVVIVGLGYPHDPAWVQERLEHFKPLPAWMSMFPPYHQVAGLERWRDYTLGVDEEQLKLLSGAFPNMRASDTGGVDAFLKTIETEVKPRLYALARVDQANQALYGHSLGGQAVTQALFTEPNAFRTFIVATPNLIWGKPTLQAEEAAFCKEVEAGRATPRVIFTAGALEGVLPETMPPGFDRAALEAILQDGPVAGGSALTKRLQALRGAKGYEVADLAVFKDLNHVSASWAALARALEFAFQPWIPDSTK
jgi:predicted alpha/beta superfamily hydrolase